MVIAVTGLPGSGKTTVAAMIGRKLDATLLRSDVVRKELYSEPRYGQEETKAVYEEVFRRAKKEIAVNNGSVVLDAVFGRQSERTKAREVALSAGTDFLLIEVVADDDLVKNRLDQRTGDASDADYQVYLQLKALYEPIAEERTVIYNAGTLEDLKKQIETLIESPKDNH